LASTGEVTLRITAKVARTADAAAIIAPMEQEIRRLLHPYVYGCDDDRLESVVVRLLKGAGKSLALAESCTGGLLSHRITNVSGASEVFLEAAVCYSNQAKMERLGVSRNTLQAWGAVSAQTAAEMAQGIRRSGADIGAAITGIAGPGGGTLEKPVGLVYLAVADEKGTETKEVRLVGDRLRIKESAADQMLNWLRLRLSEGQENEQENSNKIL
jgi:nicotinamide-nucleotide amidase